MFVQIRRYCQYNIILCFEYFMEFSNVYMYRLNCIIVCVVQSLLYENTYNKIKIIL